MSSNVNIIVAEDKLKEIFSCIPKMQYSEISDYFEVVFGFGDKKELNAFLKNKYKGEHPYPLIWLLYPYEEIHLINKVVIEKMSLILAVKTNSSMMNDQRVEETYKKVLFPLYDYIVKLFKISNNVNIDHNFKIIKYPNFSDNNSEKNVGIFKVDALKMTFDITILNTCFKKINL